MTKDHLHIIRRLFIDLRVSPRLSRPAVQQRLECILEEQLTKRLASVFDRLAGPEAWIDIDTLEVDVGRLAPEAKEDQWLEQIFQAYQTALEQKIKKTTGQNPTGAALSNLEILTYFLQRGRLPWWAETFDLDGAMTGILPRHAPRILDLLLHASTARRRWMKQFDEPTRSALLEALIARPLPLTWPQWQTLVPAAYQPLARFLFWETALEAAQHPETFSKTWPPLLFRKTSEALDETRPIDEWRQKLLETQVIPAEIKSRLLDQLPALSAEASISPENWRELLPDLSRIEIQQIFHEAGREHRRHPGQDWLRILLRHTLPALPDRAAVKTFIRKVQTSGGLPKAVKEKIPTQLSAYQAAFDRAVRSVSPDKWARLLPAWTESEVRRLYREAVWRYAQEPEKAWIPVLVSVTLARFPNMEAIETFYRSIINARNLTEKTRDRLLLATENFQQDLAQTKERPPEAKEDVTTPALAGETEQRPTKKTALKEDCLYVALAGIVLIHPFLPAFFERLGLLEEEQFRNEEARERAVHLLHFLAAGQEHPQEQELVLLKLLCGWEMEAPIARFIDLTDTEKTEANNLLEAVVQHWDVLEGTTPDELRGTFFTREGKLKWTDLGWNLTVEQRGYDVIFNTLPWGLSPIIYEWMPEMVWVEWA